MQKMVLKNGVEIPELGYGTWRIENGEGCVESVKCALAAGYRHIDTAAVYGNETSVGRAVRESGVPRTELFVTSKLWNSEGTYAETVAACEKSLKDLGMEYLDLYLIHWARPQKFHDNWEERNREVWRAFETLYEQGKVRAIGVSNFSEKHLDALLETAKIAPMVNQIELQPGHMQPALVEYCQKRDILVEAWAPFAVGKVFGIPVLQKLSQKYNRPISHILLNWYLSKGILPLVKSTTASRIAENMAYEGLRLQSADAALIDAIAEDLSSGNDPDHIDF